MSRIIQDRATGRRAERSSPSMSTRRTVLKKKAWTRKGVSDIIGNILILAITVTLFTSILWFVSSMPGPAEKVYTDFASNTAYNSNGTIWVNITHKGGATLESYRTNIYLIIGNEPRTLKLSDGLPTGSTGWTTGSTWSYLMDEPESLTTYISIMVVDTEANTVVWSSSLRGDNQSAMNNPIFGDRGMTPTPTFSGYTASFWVRITDPAKNLDDGPIKLNASAIGVAGLIPMEDDDHDGVYWAHNIATADVSWTGKAVFFLANASGKALEPARLVLQVQTATGGGSSDNPYGNDPGDLMNGTYPSNATGQASGTNGITFYYIKNIKGERTNSFSPGETVVVEVWSDKLTNTQRGNFLYLYHPSGIKLTPPSSDAAFTYSGFYLDFRKYICTFTAPDTSVDANGNNYPIQILLKDSTGIVINISDNITTKTAGSAPELQTYKLVNNVLVPCTTFNHTDTVYLRIVTKDVDTSLSTVYVSDIEVADYTGNYIIKKSPPASIAATTSPGYKYSEPLSSVYKTSGNSATPTDAGTIYTLHIVLKDAYQGWWLPNSNDYTIKISTVRDTGTYSGTPESYSLLSTKIRVAAPISTTDVAATIGSGSFTWSSSGANWEDNAIVWFKGGDQWNQNIIDANPTQGPVDIVLADINGDGREDVIVGSQDPTTSNLYWYRNENADGSRWSSAIPILKGPFDAYPGENVEKTYHSPAGYRWYGGSSSGLENEDASIWSSDKGSYIYSYSINSGGSGGPYVQPYEICAAIAVGDFDGDGDGDIVASFIHAVVYTTADDPDEVSYLNSWGEFYNRGVFVFWNDGNWTQTQLKGTDSWISSNTPNSDSNPAAMDVEVADFDLDGYPDIVAVYENGETKVWMNQWAVQTGTRAQMQEETFGSIPKSVPMTDEKTKPSSHVQYAVKVAVGDMNGDRYPDIVRTSTNSKTGTKAVYIFHTKSVPGDIIWGPSDRYTSAGDVAAVVSGDLANLVSSGDSKYLTLAEQYKLYPCINVAATARGGQDTTGNDYDVDGGKKMYLQKFKAPPQYSDTGNKIYSAYLEVAYTVDSSYTGTGSIEYSFDGSSWTSIGTPNKSQTETVIVGADITSRAVNYNALLNNLQVRFENGGSAGQIVHFDYVVVQVEFVETYGFSEVFKVANEDSAYHILTMYAKTSGSESFKVEYSFDDGNSWFPATMITGSTYKEYTFYLHPTQYDYYLVRITDNDRSINDRTINDVLYLDKLIINHAKSTVTWPDESPYKRKITEWTTTDYITGLALGDMKKSLGSTSTNGPLDIVVCTNKVDESNTLIVLKQSSTGAFEKYAVNTADLKVLCPDDDLYDAHGVALGDTDADGDLDIILIIGANFGRTPGSGPTLWHFTNDVSPLGVLKFGAGEPINSLAARGESVINLTTGNIDLSIMLPFTGILGIVAAGTLVERARKRGK